MSKSPERPPEQQIIAATLSINLTAGMLERLHAMLSDGLHGHNLSEVCERIVCEKLQRRANKLPKHKPKSSYSADTGATMNAIVRSVATTFKVDPAMIVGSSRISHIAMARHVCMYLALKAGYGSQHVGRYLKRDHSTVLAGCAKIQRQLRRDQQLFDTVSKLLLQQPKQETPVQ